MKLKVTRSQKKGMLGKHTFCLDLRAEYTPEEKDRINKYELGGEVIYSSRDAKENLAKLQASQSLGGAVMHRTLLGMNLNITIASLQKGEHIVCKDLRELIDAEDEIKIACKNVKNWLEVAAQFDGGEGIVDI